MPRGRTNIGISNLSLTIPRRVHRAAKARFQGSGATSFASYISWWLTKIPESLTASEAVEVLCVEIELKTFKN